MNNSTNDIQEYLNNLVEYDWSKYFALNMEERDQESQRIKKEFITVVKKDYQRGSLEFDKIYPLLESYNSNSIRLAAKNNRLTFIVRFNHHLNFFDFIKNIEFEEAREKENPPCDCKLRSRYTRDPKLDKLIKIGLLKDGYYMPDILKCKDCGFVWMSYGAHDSSSGNVYEEYISKENDVVEYF